MESIPGICYQESDEDLAWDIPTIILSNSKTDLNSLKCNYDQIKLIIHCNSGHENISPDLAFKYPIITANPVRSHAVAGYVASCIFERFCHIPSTPYWNSSRFWNREILFNKNMLLIGHGHVGKLVRQTMAPLLKHIHVYDPHEGYPDLPLDKGDIVVVAASLNPSSFNLVDKSFLDSLPDDFLFINTARGKIVNQKVLIETLKKRPNAFAYLDVFENEPFSFDEFKGTFNIKTTSHVAGVYNELEDELIKFCRKAVLDLLTLGSRFEQVYGNQLLKNRLRNTYLI